MHHSGQHPSPKTLRAKLQDALTALTEGRFVVVDYSRHVLADFEELQVTEKKYYDLIPVLLRAALKSSENHYAGTRPPKRSTSHKMIQGFGMSAFKAEIKRFSFPLYFKFALKPHPVTGVTSYCHVDCHPDR
jgi:hypothetical protein